MYRCVGAVLEAGKEIKTAYYWLLVALYGDRGSFDFWRPKEPTRTERVESLMDECTELFHQIVGLKNGPREWRRRREMKWEGGLGGGEARAGP